MSSSWPHWWSRRWATCLGGYTSLPWGGGTCAQTRVKLWQEFHRSCWRPTRKTSSLDWSLDSQVTQPILCDAQLVTALFLCGDVCAGLNYVDVCCSWTSAVLWAACADGPWGQTNRPFPHKSQPQLPADLGSPHSWSTARPFPSSSSHALLRLFNKLLSCCSWRVGQHSAIWMAPSAAPAAGLERVHEPSFPRCVTGLCWLFGEGTVLQALSDRARRKGVLENRLVSISQGFHQVRGHKNQIRLHLLTFYTARICLEVCVKMKSVNKIKFVKRIWRQGPLTYLFSATFSCMFCMVCIPVCILDI